ncbi:CPBP family intramembrane glutamic endopeptidase [Escherichia albertii]|uniref:CPBP family intramembrane glutamic endopeptidase n=1 Tax=Escherichia albertii TaxID=208962 RepID=UPI0009316252|nr:CPBP family intramembrane glutamic endopeptidase [Escherichia albertii]EEW0765047.1 CPBP family intramembrane metalloprotease [Escherichia albertii]EFF0802108.1 CPBP family intramembrane metalloprotease [Escherichia albertii]EFO1266220.1 CPBP family intramembrane metalloprotease [Escherichia albertii]MCU7306707.1 CPBP family intramembrane metalloprotease [Escherichia albertii]MCZ9159906.1 CPBP family intramembrane metalloprotease [Escherichia albertii]
MWIVLALSLLTLGWRKIVAFSLLMVSVGLGILSDIIDWSALFFVAAITFLSILKCNLQYKVWIKYVYETGIVLSAVALSLHLWPGFHNPVVLKSVIVGPQSTPYTMYFNFDKALVPFLLVLCTASLFKKEVKQEVSLWKWGALFLSVPFILFWAVFLGGLKPEVHFPEWLPEFILANLFFVSLAEESLFRGYIQSRLSEVMSPFGALIVASLLFGLFHYSGGALLILFATLSGIVYGLSWIWSGRLWVATLFHFGLNLCHLLFFTYPFLKHH